LFKLLFVAEILHKSLNCFLIFDWNIFLSSIPSLKSAFFYAVTSNNFVF